MTVDRENASYMPRREFIRHTAMIGAAAAIAPSLLATSSIQAQAGRPPSEIYPYKVPLLNYGHSALEPYLDGRTMEIHHGKHHAAYVANLNSALESYPELQKKSPTELLKMLDQIPEKIRTQVRNHGGGHVNHSLFWQVMKPKGGGEPEGQIGDKIKSAFGDFKTFKEEFSKAAVGVFGSGWAWLVYSKGEVQIITTANQDSPLSQGMVPLLGVDVWEHAYYLKFQNRRGDYVNSWWNVVNWHMVGSFYARAVKG